MEVRKTPPASWSGPGGWFKRDSRSTTRSGLAALPPENAAWLASVCSWISMPSPKSVGQCCADRGVFLAEEGVPREHRHPAAQPVECLGQLHRDHGRANDGKVLRNGLAHQRVGESPVTAFAHRGDGRSAGIPASASSRARPSGYDLGRPHPGRVPGRTSNAPHRCRRSCR